MLNKLYSLANEVFPDNLPENSKLYRVIQFFDSLEYEENVPQYGTVYSDEDEQIWDEETEEWVDNPDYEEPYEDILDYEDEVRTDLVGFNADNFDTEYYDINEYLERVVEVYAQFLEKTIEKEVSFGLDGVIQEAKSRADVGLDNTEQMEREME